MAFYLKEHFESKRVSRKQCTVFIKYILYSPHLNNLGYALDAWML